LCRLRLLVLNQGIDTIGTDPSMGPDGKGECHFEHLPDEDPAGHRRLRRSPAGHPEGRGLGKLYEQIQEESRERLRKLSWRVKVAGGTVAGSHLRMGAVDLEVVALAKELGVDLIVMGSRGHRGIRRAIEGSISDGVIRHAPCPVLVVRSHERAENPERHPIIHVGG
jgi:nucleotide-binding universal stress UspA family protein